MRTPKAKMGIAQRSASLSRCSKTSNPSETETLEQAFSNAKQDMLLLVQDELVLKRDIQDVQQLFAKIMSQIDELDQKRQNNYTTDASSIECPKTYARTNLNRNHQLNAEKLGLGLPQFPVDQYRIPPMQRSEFHDDESTSSYQTESSLYPSDCLPLSSDTDFSQASSTSSRSSRKRSKRVMNKTYVIEPASEKCEPSLLDKSTFFNQTDLRSYHQFMPVLCSTFAGNLTQQTQIDQDAESDDASDELVTSAVTLKRHLRNRKNNKGQNEKSFMNDTARQNLRKKGILKNSSYYRACSASLYQPVESDTTNDSPNNNDETVATNANTTLGTRPSPVGANSNDLKLNNTSLRPRMKVRFEDIRSSSSDSSSDSSSSHSDSSDNIGNQRVKRFSRKPPTPMKNMPRKMNTVYTSSDSEEPSCQTRPIRRQVSFADTVSRISSAVSSPACDSDTSLWLENSNEVFVDYETERQARLAAKDTTQMVQIEETMSTPSCASEDNPDEKDLKFPWLPQLAFDITDDSYKATLQELEVVKINTDDNVTYNDNFVLISHIEKEFKKCREERNDQDTHNDHLNALEQIEKHFENVREYNHAELPLNVSLNDSLPKHQNCVDHEVHLALGENCSFYIEDTLTMLENSKLFELHMDQLSESGFESTHTLNSSVDSSHTDSSSIDSASQKQSQNKGETCTVDKQTLVKSAVPLSLEVTRDSSPDITCLQSPEGTNCTYEESIHTMCEMNFQGAEQRDYCDSVSSSAYSSSSGMGSHNSSQSSNIALPIYNTPVTSVEPTPDTSVQADSCKLVAPFATPASTCTSFSEDATTVSRTSASGSSSARDDITLLQPPSTQTLFNLGISPIRSKDSTILPEPVAVPMNSPCGSDEEDVMCHVTAQTDISPVRMQLFPSPDGPPSPIALPQMKETKRAQKKIIRGHFFKIVQRSNSKIRNKRSNSDSDEKTSQQVGVSDRQAIYKKKRDIKKKLKVFSNLFHRKDKDATNQIQTLAHV